MLDSKSQLTSKEAPKYGLRRAVAAVGLAATVASGVVLTEVSYHAFVRGAQVQEKFEDNQPNDPLVQHELNRTANQLQQPDALNGDQTIVITKEQP